MRGRGVVGSRKVGDKEIGAVRRSWRNQRLWDNQWILWGKGNELGFTAY